MTLFDRIAGRFGCRLGVERFPLLGIGNERHQVSGARLDAQGPIRGVSLGWGALHRRMAESGSHRALATLTMLSALTPLWAMPASGLRVHAGAHSRVDTIVALNEAPVQVRPGDYFAVSDDGARDNLHVGRDGTARLRIQELPANAERIYETLQPFVYDAERHLEPSDSGAWRMTLGSAQLVYQAQPGPFPRDTIDSAYRRGGYLHPVTAPSGRVVTDDFPPNHIHQHGIWFAWTKTRIGGSTPDFWNMGRKTGRVVFDQILSREANALSVAIRGRHVYEDLMGDVPARVLEEVWETRLYPDGEDYRRFDVWIQQENLSDAPLQLPEYRYGGLGVRGRWEWNGPGEVCRFLTADGERDRVAAHTQRSRWIAMYGLDEEAGDYLGVAILDHPDNFRSPQPMRVHPTEPFFCYAPSQAGDWAIEPGTPYKARYRFVTFDGEPDAVLLERLWRDFATPPRVEWLDLP